LGSTGAAGPERAAVVVVVLGVLALRASLRDTSF
jgi:hypothetical protein